MTEGLQPPKAGNMPSTSESTTVFDKSMNRLSLSITFHGTLACMSVTVVVEGLQPRDIRALVDPLTELTTLLHAITHGEHHPRSRSVRETVYRIRNDDLLAQSLYYRPLYGAYFTRFLMPLSASPKSDVHEEIASLRNVDPEVFVKHTVSAIAELPTADPLEGLSADQHLQAEIIAASGRISRARAVLAREIIERPDKALYTLTQFLHQVAERWFLPEWERIAPKLEAEAEARQRQILAEGPAALATIIPSAQISTDPHRVSFDKLNHFYVPARSEGIILVPSHHLSPHLTIKHEQSLPVVILYEATPASYEPSTLVMKRLTALRDPTRIEICRTVMRTPQSTVDLAARMRMSPPQMARHLRALREAELVTAERRGKYVLYGLDARAVETIGTQLMSHLHR